METITLCFKHANDRYVRRKSRDSYFMVDGAGYKRQASWRSDEARYRCSTVLARLSRDKYMRPRDVWEAATRICRGRSGAPLRVAGNAIGYAAYVGMYKGVPLLRPGDVGFCAVERLMADKKIDALSDTALLLLILNVVAREVKDNERAKHKQSSR